MKFGTSLVKFGSVGDVALELRKALTAIAAGWNVEHTAEGTHAFPEQSWTPVIGGSTSTTGQTYSAQLGRVIRTGALVTAFFDVTLTAKGTIVGSLQISGLPWAIRSHQPGVGVLPFWSGMNTAFVLLTGYGDAGTTKMTLIGQTAAATGLNTLLSTADITNTTNLVGSITYLTED
jgi:hypothetical protein